MVADKLRSQRVKILGLDPGRDVPANFGKRLRDKYCILSKQRDFFFGSDFDHKLSYVLYKNVTFLNGPEDDRSS